LAEKVLALSKSTSE
jgi:hypothetical protein